MKKDIKRLEKAVRAYELSFNDNYQEMRKDPDFQIETLKESLQEIDGLLDDAAKDLATLCDIIQELYEDDGNNFFEKLELKFWRWLVNRKYSEISDECYKLGLIKEKLEYFIQRLETAKFFFA